MTSTARDSRAGCRASVTIIFLGFMLVLAATLFPYDLSLKEIALKSGHQPIHVGWGKSSKSDILKNILLFVPLGFGLAGFLIRNRRLPGVTALIAVLLVSFGLSYTIEVLQLFMPARFPSF